MKLSHIHAEGVLGIRHANLALTSPVSLVCGPNGNGKTSLAQAVAMALTGEARARGVTLKKEHPSLVNDQAQAGLAEVTTDTGLSLFLMLPSGKATPAADYVPHFAMPFVTAPEAFGALDATARREFLFKLTGLRITPKDVIERLTARGVDRLKAERVSPLLKAGMDAASKESKAKATEAKGAWRGATGEAYGSVKAGTWAAPVPAVDQVLLNELLAKISATDSQIAETQQALGGMQALKQQLDGQQARIAPLRETASMLERIQTKLAVDEAGLLEWAEKLADITVRAGAGPRVGLVHDLAAAVDYWMSVADTSGDENEDDLPARAALATYEALYGKVGQRGDPEAQAKLPEVQKSRDLMASAVANGRAARDKALAAAAELKAITEGEQPKLDAEAFETARQKLAALQADRLSLNAKADAQRQAKTQAEVAGKRTADAAAHHADVQAWDKIGEALAPDGIPGEMLAEALGPFNARLAQSGTDADWPLVVIDPDMALTYGGRPYHLVSESEKWRADAMLAEAISHTSGLKVLLLDRIDVLDLQGRIDLLAWLEILATEGELETALVFGTLKAIPADLPASITAHWISGGVVGHELQAAA